MTVCPGKALGLGTCWQIYVEDSSDSIWHDCTASAPSMQHFHFFREVQNGIMTGPEHENLEFAFCFLSHADKQELLLVLLDATQPFSHERRYKVQPCKATRAPSGTRAIFYIYQLCKESASLAICSESHKIKHSGVF